MKKLILISAVLIIALSSFVLFVPHRWTVVAENAKINFKMPSDTLKGRGTFSGLIAKFEFDASDPSASRIEAGVASASIKTDNPGKDEHLRSADFFNVEKFANIIFKSTKISKTETGFLAEGMLSLKDSLKPVSIPFTFVEEGAGAIFKGQFEIMASEFGVMKKSKSGSDKVVITVEVPVTKQ